MSTRIEHVEILPVTIPVRSTFVWGPGWSIPHLAYALVRLRTNEGVIGIGEAAPSVNSLGDTQASVVETVATELAPRILGKDLFALGDLERLFSDVARNYSAKAAVEFAIVDAMGRVLNIPVWRLLGGARDQVPLVWMAGAGAAEEVVQEVLSARDRGFRWFKLKVDTDVVHAIHLVHRVREEVPEADIYVDPNQQFDGAALRRFVDAAQDVGMPFIEEPIHWRNNPLRDRLIGAVGVPVLADESAETPTRAIHEIEQGPSSLISLKPPRLGISTTRFLAELATHHQKRAWMGSHAETDLGTLACAQLAGGIAAFDGPAELAFYQSLEGGFLVSGLEVKNATVHLGEHPGMGFEVDEASVQRWAAGSPVSVDAS